MMMMLLLWHGGDDESQRWHVSSAYDRGHYYNRHLCQSGTEWLACCPSPNCSTVIPPVSSTQNDVIQTVRWRHSMKMTQMMSRYRFVSKSHKIVSTHRTWYLFDRPSELTELVLVASKRTQPKKHRLDYITYHITSKFVWYLQELEVCYSLTDVCIGWLLIVWSVKW